MNPRTRRLRRKRRLDRKFGYSFKLSLVRPVFYSAKPAYVGTIDLGLWPIEYVDREELIRRYPPKA